MVFTCYHINTRNFVSFKVNITQLCKAAVDSSQIEFIKTFVLDQVAFHRRLILSPLSAPL